MKKGLLLLASVSLLLSTTSCSYLTKNIEDLIGLISKGSTWIDIPLRYMKDNIQEDNNAPTIKLEYSDTVYNKRNWEIKQ